MFEKFFGGKKPEEEKEYAGNMVVDPETSEVITPEEAERRKNEKKEGDWRDNK